MEAQRHSKLWSKVLPWGVSLLLHALLLVVMIYMTMVALEGEVSDRAIVPEAVWADHPFVSIQPLAPEAARPNHNLQPLKRHHQSATEVSSRGDRERSRLLEAGLGGADAGFRTPALSEATRPHTSFFGSGGNVHHVVFVIDRSGSMVHTFDAVRQQMLISISKLREFQDFHVILFAEEGPIEYASKSLVEAAKDQKIGAARFLQRIHPQGMTNPVPALRRAFDVLDAADERKAGKLIYLLTDAVFPNPDEVLKVIRERNSDKSVLVNTFLYGRRYDDTEEVMKQVAAENGGLYRYISPEQ